MIVQQWRGKRPSLKEQKQKVLSKEIAERVIKVIPPVGETKVHVLEIVKSHKKLEEMSVLWPYLAFVRVENQNGQRMFTVSDEVREVMV